MGKKTYKQKDHVFNSTKEYTAWNPEDEQYTSY